MISVSVGFRRSRAKDQEKPGVVFFHVYGPDDAGVRKCLTVNTDIKGQDRGAIETNKQSILRLIWVLYHIVEDKDRTGLTVTAEEVVDEYRQLMDDDERKKEALGVIDFQAPMRADLFSVGNGFHGCVKMVYPMPDAAEKGSSDLTEFIEYKSQLCRAENKVSTSRSYVALNKELTRFAGEIGWDKVDAGFVREFAEWLITQGFKESTQGYYLGMLRTILFQAAELGYCTARPEWFKPVITIAQPKPGDAERKQIDVGVIRRIKDLNLQENENLALVRDLFMFAFYCRGMELVDVAHLTHRNVQGNLLIFNKRLTGKEMRVPIEKEARVILDRYDSGNTYLFPLLESGRSNLFATRRTWVNNHLKVIGEIVGVKGLSFVNNIDAWTTMFSSMHITERFLSASS